MTKHPPKNEWTYGSQNYRLYEQLKLGDMTTLEIVRMGILSQTRRIADLRETLEPLGWTVYTIKVSDKPKIFRYKLAELHPLLVNAF